MTSFVHNQIRVGLETALDKFFTSLSGDVGCLGDFSNTWSALAESILAHRDDLPNDILKMAPAVANVIEVVTSEFLEHGAAMKKLQQECGDEIAHILDRHLVIQDDDHFNSNTKKVNKMLSPYIKSAYEWLLSNLHNPYPSVETREVMARESGSPRKDIDSWFIDVRKRMGWNKLRLKHYSNKRSKIVEAATRFFKEAPQLSPNGPTGIDPKANHDAEFKSIEDCVRKLYSDKLFEIQSATKLDGTGRDVTPKKARVQTEEVHCRRVKKSRTTKDRRCLSAYPSPEHSPERSPERSPESSVTSLPIPDTTSATSRKRRNCDRDSAELDVEDRRDEPQKRSRLDSYHQTSRDLAVASLPSPAASLSDIARDSSTTLSDQGPSADDYITLPNPSIPAATSAKRKRRLSDAGYDGPSKRPHNALAVPRFQTVSDPLPLANPIISECYTVFDQTVGDSIPGPVSVESLDDTQVEVDYYSYNVSSDTTQAFWPCSDSYPGAPSLLLTPNPAPSSDKYQVHDSSLNFLFENFLKDLDTSQASKNIPFLPDIPSHDPSTLFPYENTLPTQPPQEDLLSDSYFQIPSLPWDFQGNGDSFSTITPSTGTLFSNNSIPLQGVNPTRNEKEAKLKQIEALRAQLQNLEAEL